MRDEARVAARRAARRAARGQAPVGGKSRGTGGGGGGGGGGGEEEDGDGDGDDDDDGDDGLITLERLVKDTRVPVIFALSRRRIGRALGKSIKISVVGICNADGARDELSRTAEMSALLREAWEEDTAVAAAAPGGLVGAWDRAAGEGLKGGSGDDNDDNDDNADDDDEKEEAAEARGQPSAYLRLSQSAVGREAAAPPPREPGAAKRRKNSSRRRKNRGKKKRVKGGGGDRGTEAAVAAGAAAGAGAAGAAGAAAGAGAAGAAGEAAAARLDPSAREFSPTASAFVPSPSKGSVPGSHNRQSSSLPGYMATGEFTFRYG